MSAGLKVLICGGRDYDNRAAFVAEMAMHANRMAIGLIVTGGAAGADAMARAWAEAVGIPVAVFPANWKLRGKGAGPRRNQAMLDWMKPDVVIAFPGGRGTADMVERAAAAGVRVVK